jgi:predicted aspartyl protease
VRALYRRAHEREHTKNAMLIEHWRLIQDHMTGTIDSFRLGKDERQTMTLGPFFYENGERGGVRWQENRNGIVSTLSGYHERDTVDERIWESRDTTDVRLIGESVAANAYVVSVNPPLGRPEWLFIDKRSGLVVRRERVERRRRYVTTYDDFKLFDGVLEPSHIRTVDGLGNERDQTILSRLLDSTPDIPDIAIPTSRTVVEFPPGVSSARLPVRFIDGLIVVRVAIGTRSYDFLLDSGAVGIVIDPSIVESLGLERYGGRVGETVGTYDETTTILPILAVGPLRMHNLVTRVLPVPFRPDEQTHIAGLLGFDFFAQTVMHIDPELGIVEAIAPRNFRVPADATPISLALDDRVPAVRARVGPVAARMTIDTGANHTILESPFAERVELIDRSAAFARFSGVGAVGTATSARIKEFSFADTTFPNLPVDISEANLGTEDIDGLLGSDLTHNFEMYLDYSANTAYLHRLRR